jgi:hypothetical protein
MPKWRGVGRLVLLLPISAILVLAGGECAGAGGYSGGNGGLARAASDAWTVLVSEGYAEHSSHTFANAAASGSDNGQLLQGHANAGNNTSSYIIGNANYSQSNSAKAKVYVKGDGVMAKARSQTYTMITIDGHVYFVAEEVARAMARYTPIGSAAAADSETNVTASGNGYIGVNTGTTNEATVRTQN